MRIACLLIHREMYYVQQVKILPGFSIKVDYFLQILKFSFEILIPDL